jgi:hypothetical protein
MLAKLASPLVMGHPVPWSGKGMHETMRVFASEPGFLLARWKNLSLQLWGAEVSASRLDRCGELNDLVLSTHPDRLVTVAVALPSASPRLGSVERAKIGELSRRQRGKTLAAVQIVDGTGFWASAVRAMLVGLNMMSETSQRVFADDARAAEWVARSGFVDASSRDVLDALADARRAYAAPPA